MAAAKTNNSIKEEFSILPNNIIKEINTSISNFIAPEVIKRTMCTYKRFDELQLQKLEDYLELTARAKPKYFELYEAYFTEMHYKELNFKAIRVSERDDIKDLDYKKDLLERNTPLKPKSEYVDLLDHLVKYHLTDNPYPTPKRGNAAKKEKIRREPKPRNNSSSFSSKPKQIKTKSPTTKKTTAPKMPKISYPKGGGNNNNYSWDKKPSLGMDHLKDGKKIDNTSSYVKPQIVKEAKRPSTSSFVDKNAKDSKRPNLK